MNVPPAVSNDLAILIEQSAMIGIRKRVAEENGRREIGGLLLGYRFVDAIRVMRATFPGRLDISTRMSFHRRCPSHQRAASVWWARSAMKGDWVGEWHSHPENNPKPSHIDIKSWRRVVAYTEKPMLFIIVGFQSSFSAIISPGSEDIKEVMA